MANMPLEERTILLDQLNILQNEKNNFILSSSSLSGFIIICPGTG